MKKTYATVISFLAEALQKRYNEIDEVGSSNAHWLLADLHARYGGAYDPKIIAIFLIESQNWQLIRIYEKVTDLKRWK
jgi:hypothetical protein